MKKLLAIAMLSTIALQVQAADPDKVQKSIPLKDGSTVYIFKDGKMAMEDKWGRVISMKKGHVMETKDGKKIIMEGDEVFRLEKVLHDDHRVN